MMDQYYKGRDINFLVHQFLKSDDQKRRQSVMGPPLNGSKRASASFQPDGFRQ